METDWPVLVAVTVVAIILSSYLGTVAKAVGIQTRLLQETTYLLQQVHDELAYLNKDKREAEREWPEVEL